jgi:hypothetical protein
VDHNGTCSADERVPLQGSAAACAQVSKRPADGPQHLDIYHLDDYPFIRRRVSNNRNQGRPYWLFIIIIAAISAGLYTVFSRTSERRPITAERNG